MKESYYCPILISKPNILYIALKVARLSIVTTFSAFLISFCNSMHDGNHKHPMGHTKDLVGALFFYYSPGHAGKLTVIILSCLSMPRKE